MCVNPGLVPGIGWHDIWSCLTDELENVGFLKVLEENVMKKVLFVLVVCLASAGTAQAFISGVSIAGVSSEFDYPPEGIGRYQGQYDEQCDCPEKGDSPGGKERLVSFNGNQGAVGNFDLLPFYLSHLSLSSSTNPASMTLVSPALIMLSVCTLPFFTTTP